MPIYIAKNFNGKVESIVLAKNKEFASTYWQGRDIYPYSISVRSENNLKDHITGVIPLINMKITKIRIDGFNSYEELIEDSK